MSAESKWLLFREEPLPKGRKTRLWRVLTKDLVPLGEVCWFNSWRRYVFIPAPDTIFEQDCLRDIAKFVDRATAEHKAAREGSSA